jgi:hypothetical protein
MHVVFFGASGLISRKDGLTQTTDPASSLQTSHIDQQSASTA